MAKKGKGRPRRIKYRRLSIAERGEVIGYIKSGWSDNKIAKQMSCSQPGIGKIRKKYEENLSVEDQTRSGRPRITSESEDRALKFRSLKNRWQTAPALRLTVTTKQKKRPSITTVQRRLREAGLYGRVAAKKPLLSYKQRINRLNWAKKYKDWTIEQWRNVIFSDESPFTLLPRSGRIYVRRRANERFLPPCLIPTLKFGGGKIQVWGCFSYTKVGPLKRIEGKLTGAKYREILKNHMAPFLREMKRDKHTEFIFQHDNDPKHTAKVVKNYLKNTNIVMLDWPSMSPDINPIENLWNQLKDKLHEAYERASTLDELFDLVKASWGAIDVQRLQTLIDRMPNRCAAVIKAKGWATKY